MINSNLDMTYSVRGRPYSVRINDWEFLFEFCSLGNLFVRFLFLFVFWWLSLASKLLLSYVSLHVHVFV
jgi:hypothetical protein